MMGTRELCALLLAGGMGAGSVVVVQQAKPAISKPAKPRPKLQKAAQRAAQPQQSAECAPRIADMPLPAPSIGPVQLPLLQPIADQFVAMGAAAGGAAIAGGGGFVPTGRPDPLPIAPGVPQPDTWVLLVAGFGFLGLALRRNRPANRAVLS